MEQESQQTVQKVTESKPIIKTNRKFLAIVAFIAVVLSAGGILLLKATQAPQPFPSPNETANWRTYKNEKYLYSVQYPLDWEITYPFTKSPQEAVYFTKEYKNNKSYSDSTISIIIGENPQMKTPKEWYSDLVKSVPAGIDTSDYKYEETVFLGYKGVIVNSHVLVFAKQANIFRIGWGVSGDYDRNFTKLIGQIYTQILSTFRFVGE